VQESPQLIDRGHLQGEWQGEEGSARRMIAQENRTALYFGGEGKSAEGGAFMRGGGSGFILAKKV